MVVDGIRGPRGGRRGRGQLDACAGCSGCAAPADRHTAIAVRGYADLPPGSERSDGAQFIAMQKAGWPAYAWSFPIGDGTANVGFGMLLPKLHATGRPGREVLHGRLAALLPDLPARDLKAHHLPLSPGRPRSRPRPGAAGRRRGQPDQPADRRGHLLRAGLRPARRRRPR